MIPKETIRDILETAQIEDVVGDFVNLKSRGINLFGLCPFHDEKTPSFSVNPSKNFYYCFGCGKGGGSVNFLMEHEQMSYPDALRWLADRYNIVIEEKEQTPEELAKQDQTDTLYGLLRFAVDHYKDTLNESREGRAVGQTYFQERGLLPKTIEEFELGFSSEEGGLVDRLKQMGFEDEAISEAGLSNRKGGDFFRNRVVFPIHSLSGKPVGLAGRILGSGKGFGPKYMNSSESLIYNKSKLLYGMHLDT